jgi:hypothetical protein
VDASDGLDDVEKRKFLTVPGLELRPLGRPARRQSVYQLCYLISDCMENKHYKYIIIIIITIIFVNLLLT